jgi:hypothetical protein
MISSQNRLGSLVLDIHGDVFNCRFLDTAAVVRDSFRIVKGTPAAVADGVAPPRLRLAAPRPNPSQDAVNLAYELPRDGVARLELLGVDGRRIATLASGPQAAGRHEAEWNGRDARGGRAAPGVYFAVLEGPGGRRVQKLVRAR